MSLYSEFEVSSKNEQNGVDFTYTDDNGKPVFKVRLARAGGSNSRFDEVQEREMAPYRRQKKMSAQLREQIYRRVFAEACALPGTWMFKERAGMKCAGNSCDYAIDESGVKTNQLAWTPEVPRARLADGFVKGIEQRDGTIVPDTAETVAVVFEALPELFLMLFREATSRDAFRVEDLEEDSKN